MVIVPNNNVTALWLAPSLEGSQDIGPIMQSMFSECQQDPSNAQLRDRPSSAVIAVQSAALRNTASRTMAASTYSMPRRHKFTDLQISNVSLAAVYLGDPKLFNTTIACLHRAVPIEAMASIGRMVYFHPFDKFCARCVSS